MKTIVTDEPDLSRAARSVVDENGVILYHENIDPGLNLKLKIIIAKANDTKKERQTKLWCNKKYDYWKLEEQWVF